MLPQDAILVASVKASSAPSSLEPYLAVKFSLKLAFREAARCLIINKPRQKQQQPLQKYIENLRKAAQSIVNSDNFDRSCDSECFLTRLDKFCLRKSGAAARGD